MKYSEYDPDYAGPYSHPRHTEIMSNASRRAEELLLAESDRVEKHLSKLEKDKGRPLAGEEQVNEALSVLIPSPEEKKNRRNKHERK